MGERRKAKKKSILWMVLIVLLTVPTIAVCAFPYLGLSEGSLPYALANGLYGIFEKNLSFFPQGELSVYGLVPLAGFALLVLVTTLLGAGVISFLLKAIAFYSLYLVFCYAQGAKGFEISTYLPSNYQWLALGAFFLTCLLLLCSWISRHKKNRKVEATKMAKIEQTKEETGPEVQDEDQTPVEPVQEQQEPLKVATSQDKPVRPKSTLDSKTAHKSLTEVKVPKFDKFPNSLAASYLKPHDGVSVYDVVQREAEIKKAAEEQRRLEAERIKALEEERQRRIALEEERQRQEAEAEKKRLESLFKPRTLMKRLSEEAEVEKKFSSYQGEDAEVDYGISPYQIQQEYQSQQTNVNFKAQNAKVGFQTPQSASVQFEAPRFSTSQFGTPQFEASQFEAPPAQMINPYAVQYSQSQQPTAPQQEQVQLESNPQPQAQFQPQPQTQFQQPQAEPKLQPQAQAEPKPQPSSAFKDEELRAQTEMERQQKLREEEQARKLAEAELARKATEAPPVQAPQHEAQQEEEDEAEDDEADFEKSKAEFDRETEAEAEKKEKKTGPDIDYVSGIAGLKSSAAGNSYLIDKQKFVYQFPPESFLQHYPVSAKIYEDIENDPTGMAIVNTFKDFNIETTLLHIQHGPTFTLYELSLQRGVRVSKVVNLAEDVAMNLAVANVRILAPIPGKNAIGIEVPNKKRDTIGFDVMMEALKAKPYKIPMVLGKNITGDSIVIDLTKTPHLLVAGTTGSGKSVCINGLICSVLYTKTPKEVRMLLVDPKMVELSVYNGIPHLLTPVITDPKKALKAMNFIVEEMERRMALFASVGARKIEDYNEKIVEKGLLRVKLPYIMVIIDEFADLMLAVGKELEASIKRITAVARFCGIHLVLATQRPSADVITGIIKSNIPTQIAFAVANGTNSRIIIDSNGAENLLGRGDMLYNSPEFRTPTRIQGAYIDSEIEQIVNFVKTQGQPDYIDESYFEDDEEDEEEEKDSASSASEDMFSRAWKIVSDRGEASASYLQRRLNIGYNRAANLIEQLEDAGYIGPARGAKPREILKLYGSD